MAPFTKPLDTSILNKVQAGGFSSNMYSPAPVQSSIAPVVPAVQRATAPAISSGLTPVNGMINGIPQAEYNRLDNLYKTPQQGMTPSAPIVPAVNTPTTNWQGVQVDKFGEAVFNTPTLNINPMNANGAIPSTSLGSVSKADVLGNRNYLQQLQDKILGASLASDTELNAQKNVNDLAQQDLDLQAKVSQEADRLASSSDLTKEQATNFLTETYRRGNIAKTNLNLQQYAQSNILNNEQLARKNQLEAYKTLYGINQPVTVGGNLVNPVTGEVMYSAPKAPVQVSAGETIIDPSTGEVIYQGQAKSDLTPYQQFQATQAIANQTAKFTDASKELQRQSNVLTQTWNRYASGEAKDLNATTQAIVTTFNKLLDPTSVVREAEYDRSASGQALLSTITGKLSAVIQGGPGLTPASLKELVDLGNLYAQNAQSSITQANQRATQMAEQFGLNPSFVTTPGYTQNTSQTGVTNAPIIKTKVGDINPNF